MDENPVDPGTTRRREGPLPRRDVKESVGLIRQVGPLGEKPDFRVSLESHAHRHGFEGKDDDSPHGARDDDGRSGWETSAGPAETRRENEGVPSGPASGKPPWAKMVLGVKTQVAHATTTHKLCINDSPCKLDTLYPISPRRRKRFFSAGRRCRGRQRAGSRHSRSQEKYCSVNTDT